MTDTKDPKPDLREALRQLAKAPASPSATRKIGGLLDEIEASLAAGATLKEVRDTLASNDFALSERAFSSALYRARKKKKGSRKEDRPQPSPQAQATTEGEDLSDLDPRARRERMASRFVKESSTNPLLARLTAEKDKKV